MTATEYAADRLVKVVSHKYSYLPQFSMVMKYRQACNLWDLVPRPYDNMYELVGFIQDPRYDEIGVSCRRWFTLAVLTPREVQLT